MADGLLWRVGLYIRLSREDGGRESESVINQRKILTQYMETEFDGAYAIAGCYVDDGLTGTDDTRAEFMRMIADVERGQLNCVVCKTLARAFRNYSDQGYYLEVYFTQKKVRFISLGDPRVDTFLSPDALTGLEVPITGLMNDRFAAKTSGDVRRTFHMKRQKGEFIGAFAPYGFLKDPRDKNRLIPDEQVVPVKREMLRLVTQEGLSLAAVARRLNELSVPNPTAYKRQQGLKYENPHAVPGGSLWSGATVRRVLLNPANVGRMVQGRQRVISYKVHSRESVPQARWYQVDGAIEPTFTGAEYAALQALLARPTRTPAGRRGVFPLAGFLRCADCGGAMHRKGAGGHVYYICRTYGEKSKTACTRHGIREDEVVRQVTEALQGMPVRHADPVSPLASAARPDKMLAERRRELSRANALADGLYEDLKRGIIDDAEYARMKGKYRAQAERLKGAIEALQNERFAAQEARDHPDGAPKASNGETLDRALLVQAVESILVHEGKRITVRFRDEHHLSKE